MVESKRNQKLVYHEFMECLSRIEDMVYGNEIENPQLIFRYLFLIQEYCKAKADELEKANPDQILLPF